MPNTKFIDAAIKSGFTGKQAEFLDEWLAKYPHTHDVEDIDGLAELLEDNEEDGIDEIEE